MWVNIFRKAREECMKPLESLVVIHPVSTVRQLVYVSPAFQPFVGFLSLSAIPTAFPNGFPNERWGLDALLLYLLFPDKKTSLPTVSCLAS